MSNYQKPRRKNINNKLLVNFALSLNAGLKQTFVYINNLL